MKYYRDGLLRKPNICRATHRTMTMPWNQKSGWSTWYATQCNQLVYLGKVLYDYSHRRLRKNIAKMIIEIGVTWAYGYENLGIKHGILMDRNCNKQNFNLALSDILKKKT